MIFITGDTHRDFNRIFDFNERFGLTEDDIMIILGDVGINYFGDKRDIKFKEMLISKLKCTIFAIHGNHEMNPENMNMQEKVWNNGTVYYEEEFPTIIYAKDGEIYNLNGKETLVLGGAYSVDKYYRLSHGLKWFEDEQISNSVKDRCISNIENNNWKVDIVLSHTVPYNYRPIDLFLSFIDQSTVDETMENWLQYIEDKLNYQKWYCGHYHCNRIVDKIEMMFDTIKEL